MYIKQIKIFKGKLEELELSVNLWLTENPKVEVESIQLAQSECDNSTEIHRSVMVIFLEARARPPD